MDSLYQQRRICWQCMLRGRYNLSFREDGCGGDDDSNRDDHHNDDMNHDSFYDNNRIGEGI